MLLLLLAIFSPCHGHRMVKRSLASHPLALCNDGTPAAYYYSDDTLEASKLVIFLQGGGQCSSVQQCEHRCHTIPDKCTEDPADHHIEDTLMWSTDPEVNPPFHDFGKVSVDYCSSDVYTGTREASADSGGFIFHGRHIVEAVVEDLISLWENLPNLEQLVFMGSSAGGFGVGFNCDMVADRFHQELPSLDVRCLADAGDFFPPYLSLSPQCDTLLAMAQVGLFWQAEGDTSCFEGPWDGSQDKECMTYMTAYNNVTTPMMVVNHYVDTVVHGPCTPALDQDPEFWERWEEEVYAMAIRYMEDKPANGLFLSNCKFHSSVGQEFAWQEMPVPLVSQPGESLIFREVIRNWLTGEGPYQAMDLPLEKNPECPY